MIEYALFENYLEENTGLSEQSKKLYTWSVRRFLKEKPDTNDVTAFNEYLTEHCIKKRSNYVYSAIKHYILFKHKGTKAQRLLKGLVKPKNRDPVIESQQLSPSEKTRVISLIKSHKHRIIAKIQDFTGKRAGDILRLKDGDVRYDETEEDLIMQINFTTKGGRKQKSFILDAELQNEIDDYIQNHREHNNEYLFMDKNKSKKFSSINTILRSNYWRYWNDLKEAVAKAGYDVKTFSTHDFRRCFAIEVYYQEDKDIYAVMKSLGHKSPNTTFRYLTTGGVLEKDILKRRNHSKYLNKKAQGGLIC